MLKHQLNVLLMILLPDEGTEGVVIATTPESPPVVSNGTADLGDDVQLPAAPDSMTPSNKTIPERSDTN